jgi:hypothetical protein
MNIAILSKPSGVLYKYMFAPIYYFLHWRPSCSLSNQLLQQRLQILPQATAGLLLRLGAELPNHLRIHRSGSMRRVRLGHPDGDIQRWG